MTSSSDNSSYQSRITEAPVGIIEMNQRGEYVDVNEAACELVGYSEEELLDMSIGDLAPAGANPDELSLVTELKESGHIRYEGGLLHKDGYEVAVILDAVALDDGRFVGYVQDNTEQKEYGLELRKVKNRSRLLFEKAPKEIVIHDRNGEILDVNQQLIQNLGYTYQELTSMHVSDIEVGHTRSEAWTLWDQLDIGESREVEGEYERKEGSTYPIELLVNKIEINGNIRVLMFARDITEIKEARQALSQTREKLREVIDLIPDPIYVKNRDDDILISNEANAELLGETTPEEVEGSTEREFFPGDTHYETLRQRDVDVIKSGESTTFEEELTNLVGGKHIFKTTRIPFEDPETGEETVLGYARDITELKEYERELEEQRDTFEVLNQVLRHDIRNDLQLITASADVLTEECQEDELEEHLSTIQESADHAAELTETAQEIADVMVSSPGQDLQLDLRSVLKEEVSKVQSSYPDASISYGATIPAVVISTNEMISSVFRNLLTNAIHHNDKTIPEVTVSATEQDGVVIIRIADNGPGIPDNQKEIVFGKGERGLESTGTGLGLYLVDTLVTDYGGDIWVEDNKPDGSVFIVELPVRG